MKPPQVPARNADAVKFGKRVRQWRLKAGLTQEALAEKAGISPRYVQAVEQGRRLPNVLIGIALLKSAGAKEL